MKRTVEVPETRVYDLELVGPVPYVRILSPSTKMKRGVWRPACGSLLPRGWTPELVAEARKMYKEWVAQKVRRTQVGTFEIESADCGGVLIVSRQGGRSEILDREQVDRLVVALIRASECAEIMCDEVENGAN